MAQNKVTKPAVTGPSIGAATESEACEAPPSPGSPSSSSIENASFLPPQMYRRFVESMNEGLLMQDGKGAIVFANERACAIFQRRLDALIGMNLQELIDPRDREELLRQLDAARTRRGAARAYEARFTRPDGSGVATRVSPRSLFDDTGAYRGSFAVITDLSELRSARDALQRRQNIDQLIREISLQFINVPTHEMDAEIEHALEVVRRFLQVKAAFVNRFHDDGQRFWMSHCSIADGSSLCQDRTRHEVFGKFAWWADTIRRNREIVVRKQDDIPLDAANERERMSIEGADAWLETPMRVRNRPIGSIGLLSAEPHAWDEAERELLQVIGSIVAGALLRQGSESQLRESERRYRALFESSVDGVLIMRENVFIDANQMAERLYGATRGELVGRTPMDFSPPLQPDGRPSEESAREKIQAAFAGQPQAFEWRHCRLDGTAFEAEVRLNLVELSGGRYLQAAVRDVTERKRTEYNLATTQALLLEAIEQTPAGIIIADAPDARIRTANSAALGIRASDEDLTNIPADLHPIRWQTYRTDGSVYAPEDLPLSRAVMQGETVRNEEVVIRRPHGEERWVLVNAAPVRDAQGQVVAGIAVFPDVTESRQMERALHTILDGTAALTGEDYFHSLVRYLAQTLQVRNAHIGVFNEAEELQILAAWTDGKAVDTGWTIPLEQTVYREVRRRGTVFIPDGARDAIPRCPFVPQQEVRAFVGMPLTDVDGRIRGVLALMHDQRFDTTPVLPNLLSVFASRASAELARREAEEEVDRRLLLEHLVAETSTRLMNVSDEELLREIEQALSRVGGFLGVDRMGMNLFDDHGRRALLHAEWTVTPQQRWNSEHGPFVTHYKQVPKIFDALLSGHPWSFEKISELPSTMQGAKAVANWKGIKSWMAVPMTSAGSVVGFVGMGTTSRERTWSEHEITMLRILGETFANALERNEKERALREREAQLVATLESTADGILAVGRGGSIDALSQRFVEMWQFDRTPQVGEDGLSLLRGMAEQLQQPHDLLEPLEQLFPTADLDLSTLHFKDGRIFEAFSCPLNIAGSIGGRVWSFRDVTERRRLERQLLESQRTETISQLAGEIAHEVKNPLFAISAGIQTLKAVHSFEGEQEDIVNAIYRETVRVNQLVMSLLDYHRHPELERRSVRLSALLEEVRIVNQPLIRTKHGKLVLDLAADAPEVYIDESKMIQVMTNLVQNAIEVSPPGEDVRISTSISSERKRLRIAVADRGPGLPADLGERIFDLFTSQKQGGHGMGLAISKRIVDEHGGTIRAVARDGGGAQFIVELPLED